MLVTYYADLIFAWNYLVDYILLVLIHPERKKNYLRIGVAAATGAIITILGLCWWQKNIFILFILRFLCACLMSMIAIQTRGLGNVLCNSFLLYGVGGSVYGVCNLVTYSYNFSGKSAFLSVLVSLSLLLISKQILCFRKKDKIHSGFLTAVQIKHNGNIIRKKAFFDSGNHLYEPISGKTVILIRENTMKQLCLNPETVRMIPYASIGKKAGMLLAYRLDEIIINSGKSQKVYRNIYAAVAEDKLFKQECCEIILHAEQMIG